MLSKEDKRKLVRLNIQIKNTMIDIATTVFDTIASALFHVVSIRSKERHTITDMQIDEYIYFVDCTLFFCLVVVRIAFYSPHDFIPLHNAFVSVFMIRYVCSDTYDKFLRRQSPVAGIVRVHHVVTSHEVIVVSELVVSYWFTIC